MLLEWPFYLKAWIQTKLKKPASTVRRKRRHHKGFRWPFVYGKTSDICDGKIDTHLVGLRLHP